MKNFELPQENSLEHKPEHYAHKLTNLLNHIADTTNHELGGDVEGQQKKALLHADCRLDMRAFQKSVGGPYQKVEDIKQDQKFVDTKQAEWASANDHKVQQFYQQQYDIQAVKDIVAKRQEENLSTDGSLLEMSVTAILHKILGAQFLVVRTTDYDDYAHGVDNLIVDRQTGEVICAFDEVSDVQGGSRYQDKVAKVIQRAKQGGTTIKYGLTFEDGQLIKQSIEDVPTFYLALSKRELYQLLDQMSFQMDHVTQAETEVFANLVSLLDDQIQRLQDEKVSLQVEHKLAKFKKTLEKLKLIIP